MTAEEMKLSMERTWINNRGNNHIPTHYIVGSDGGFIKVNELDKIVGATKDYDANVNGIHIEIVGNFNNTEPTNEQYVMTRQLIEWITEKHPGIEVKLHRDFQPHTCPGKLFDVNKVVTTKKLIGEFSLSRYYSVQPNQSRYYNGRTYEEDFKMNCAGDCLYTANGHKLTDNDMYKSVACPKEYELGTKIYLEGIGEVVCNDRGGAIVMQGEKTRLDMWCGVGDTALDNWNKCPTGERKGYIIK